MSIIEYFKILLAILSAMEGLKHVLLSSNLSKSFNKFQWVDHWRFQQS